MNGAVAHKGCRLAYGLHGEGPPVIFIQGVGLHGLGWTPQVTELRSSFQCLTFDNRGTGASQPCGAPLTIEQMAEDTACILDALRWDSAHVVGHSMGGTIALELAAQAPHRVRSLSLLCSVARGRDATRLTRRMLWIGLRSSIGSLRARRRAFLELVLAPADLNPEERDVLAQELEPIFGHDLARRPPIALRQVAALRSYDGSGQLHRLGGISTLVVSAEHDCIAPPASGNALAQRVPGARYVEIPDASHGVTIRKAARVNQLLREHLTAAELRLDTVAQ